MSKIGLTHEDQCDDNIPLELVSGTFFSGFIVRNYQIGSIAIKVAAALLFNGLANK
jgi:hypothetical protein